MTTVRGTGPRFTAGPPPLAELGRTKARYLAASTCGRVQSASRFAAGRRANLRFCGPFLSYGPFYGGYRRRPGRRKSHTRRTESDRCWLCAEYTPDNPVPPREPF